MSREEREERQFWEAERQRDLAEAEQAHGNLLEFVPGSVGAHELLDRASILADMWERLVRTHPTCLVDPELYSRAVKIAELLAEFYQLATSRAAADPSSPMPASGIKGINASDWLGQAAPRTSKRRRP
jgi:hypothetical protein